ATVGAGGPRRAAHQGGGRAAAVPRPPARLRRRARRRRAAPAVLPRGHRVGRECRPACSPAVVRPERPDGQEDLSLSATLPRHQRGGPSNPLRAPGDNGAVVAVPPLEEVGRLLAANRQRLEALARGPGLLGRSWIDLRLQARRAAVSAAREYLARRGEPVPEVSADA